MKVRNGVLLAVLFGWVGSVLCQAVKARSGNALYIAPELKITPKRTVDAALAAPLPSPYTVTIGDRPNGTQKTIDTCIDLLALKGTAYTTGSSRSDTNLLALDATCEALKWIQGAKPAIHSSFQNFSFRQINVKQLPPQLALSISDEEATHMKEVVHQGLSILAIAPDAKLRVKTANEAELIAPEDWTAVLTVYAHGDFLGDGNEELLVRWDAQATGGTYTTTSVFLLAHDKNRLIVVRQAP